MVARFQVARCVLWTINTITVRSLPRKGVPILPEDTAESLAARVQEAERELYPQAIQFYAQGHLGGEGEVVESPLKPKPHKKTGF